MENYENLEQKFEIGEELGSGRYGQVLKCRRKSDGEQMAIKFARTITKTAKENFQREIEIALSLDHAHVVKTFHCFYGPRQSAIIMELISGGELFERIVEAEFTLTENECKNFMTKICGAVAYLHKNCILHLDLKPENILCISPHCYDIKIIDFGLAQRFSDDRKAEIRTLAGTAEFVATEVANFEPLGPATDMWSVGVIAYILLSGLSPFLGESDAETFVNIRKVDFTFEEEEFENISKEAKDFISGLLLAKMSSRMSAEACLGHDWLISKVAPIFVSQISVVKHKQFLARRKWIKVKNVFKAAQNFKTISGAPVSLETAENSNNNDLFITSYQAGE